MGLIPEAAHLLGEKGYGWVLVALIGSYLFEVWFCDLHHHDHEDVKKGCGSEAVALVVVGDTIHNFIDGVAIAASFLINPGLGVVTAISTFLHEVPHEIGDFGVLLKAGWKKEKVLWVNFLSSLSTIAGAMMIYWFNFGSQVEGVLLAIAGGMFLYLGASDFLPKADEEVKTLRAVAVLLLGVMLMYATLKVVPHSHGNGSDEHEGEHLEEVSEGSV